MCQLFARSRVQCVASRRFVRAGKVKGRAALMRCANTRVSSGYQTLLSIQPRRPSALNLTRLLVVPENATRVLALDNSVIGHQLSEAAANKGVVLLELLGGVCTGFEMCMCYNINVKRYLYYDISHVVQLIADFRVMQMHEQHPTLLPYGALHWLWG